MNSFDYVIVGAGSAGCVLANRLTEDPNTTVCLVETGPEDSSPLIHVPALYAFLVQVEGESKYSYGYDTVPQKEFSSVTLKEGSANITDTLGGTYQVPQNLQEKRRGYQPRGKTLGGSSSINGMLSLLTKEPFDKMVKNYWELIKHGSLSLIELKNGLIITKIIGK